MQEYLLSTIYYLLSTISKIGVGRDSRGRANRAFTLIEILIAITILMVIVMLGSMVFQETTGAFQSGNEKVKRQVAVRNVLGAITRDMALAVSSTNYPGLPKASFTEKDGATFIALTGTPGIDLDGETNSEVRTAQKVSYKIIGKGTVQRTVQSTKFANGKWETLGEPHSTELNDDDDDRGNPIDNLKFKPEGKYDNLPERIRISAEVSVTPKFHSVGAGSGGKKGWEYEEDDIYVGYDPK